MKFEFTESERIIVNAFCDAVASLIERHNCIDNRRWEQAFIACDDARQAYVVHCLLRFNDKLSQADAFKFADCMFADASGFEREYSKRKTNQALDIQDSINRRIVSK